MSFKPHMIHRSTQRQATWPGMAVLVEAMVLMTVLLASLAVIMQLFSAATIRAQQGQRLAEAVAMATDTAESFANDPATANGATIRDGLLVQCQVSTKKSKVGTLYSATITVLDTRTVEPIYELVTSHYDVEVS